MIDTFVAVVLLMAQADPTAEQSIEQAARTFRIQTYQRYRQNRFEYDRRIDAAESTVERWKSGKITRYQLEKWLETAGQNPSRNLPPRPADVIEKEPTKPTRVFSTQPEIMIESEPIQREQISKRENIESHTAEERSRWWPDIPQRTTIVKFDPKRFYVVDPQTRQSAQSDPADDSEPIELPSANSDDVETLHKSVSAEPIHSSNASIATIEVRDSRIDIAVLVARIESENIALKAFAAKLLETRSFETSELELLVGELDQLVARQRISVLYRDLLSARHRRSVPRPVDVEPILTTLGQRIFEIESAMFDQFHEESEDSERLRRISKKVQSWQN